MAMELGPHKVRFLLKEKRERHFVSEQFGTRCVALGLR